MILCVLWVVWFGLLSFAGRIHTELQRWFVWCGWASDIGSAVAGMVISVVVVLSLVLLICHTADELE